MTLAWIVYVLAFSLAIASVAYFAERVGALPRSGGRWIWTAAMVISVIVPIAFAWQPVGSMPEHPSSGATVARTPPAGDTSAQWVMVSGGSGSWSVVRDAGIEAIWLVLSMLLFVWWVVTQMRLRRYARSWIPADVAGRRVLLSDSAGPAVVGALRARIVAPQWLVELPRRKQDIVLAHEEEHIAAATPNCLRRRWRFWWSCPGICPYGFNWHDCAAPSKSIATPAYWGEGLASLSMVASCSTLAAGGRPTAYSALKWE